jgi:hypothetical protein
MNFKELMTMWVGVAVMLWTYIQKVLSSNLGWDTSYCGQVFFCGFPQSFLTVAGVVP